MSWQSTPGTVVSGPPTSSSSHPVSQRLRPNSHGVSAFHRESQLSAHYPSAFASPPYPKRRSEWDVVRENHRFIRDDEQAGGVSWEERVARAYESKLFKEFALIDLKHYKSKQLALRWRTAPEVVEGIGEDTCAALRCRYHQPPEAPSPPRETITFGLPSEGLSRRGGWDPEDEEERVGRGEEMPELKSFELPFVYQEAGERKEALVKVRLCPKCVGKLLWKPGQDKRQDMGEDKRKEKGRRGERERSEKRDRDGSQTNRGEMRRRSRRSPSEGDDRERRRQRDERQREGSRSRSPRRSHHHEHERRPRNIM